MTEGVLAPGREALVRVAAALATRERGRLRDEFARARTVAAPGEVDEVLLQSHLFVGFPDALEAMVLWREASDSPAPAPSPEEPDLWSARGPVVCEQVYGHNYRKLRRNVTALHPDLDRWMVEGGYGRVIGRPGLDLATRELCIAALLVVWGAPRQLHSHLRGALNAGASEREVREAVRVACEYAGAEAAAEASALLARVAPPVKGAVGRD